MTSLELYVHTGTVKSPEENFVTTPADYTLVDLVNDYLIWTGVDDTVKDGMTTEPSETQLINASPIIDPAVEVIVPVCLLMDYSGIGVDCLKEVKGMGTDHVRYAFLFHFDGATATEPQLEAWDDDTMLTIVNKVLGGSDVTPIENPEDSMVNAVCTTTDPDPGEDWGAPLAGDGATYVVKLNQGDGAITEIGGKDLYANIKIKIPTNFANPAIETFSLCVRYTFIS